MLKLFFKTALRTILKRKAYSALNIFGLALGITSCLLIFQYVSFERSFDRFQPESKQIYRVQLDDYQNGQLAVKCAANYSALAGTMKTDFPEVESATKFFITRMLLSNNEKNIRFSETRVYYAEPAFIGMFGVHLIKGDPGTALLGPDKIVLTEESARKYFGSTDVLGRVLEWKNGGVNSSMQVTGVCENYPVNSHIHFNMLVSYNTFSTRNGTAQMSDDPVEHSWYWTDFYTYITLKPGSDAAKLQAKLPAFADRHVNSLTDNLANHDHSVFRLYALPDIHLYSHYTEEAEPGGDGRSVAFLFLTGFFIIGIAWINYINLATARSMERAREVGVRKVLGALRKNLIGQFLMESFLMNLTALLVAVFFAILLSRPFTLLTGRPLRPLNDLPIPYLKGFAMVFIAGTFLSGIYPALVLSGFRPVTVLKGVFKNSGKGQWLRKGLIVGQFSISILLIAGTIIIYRQVQFMRSQRLGVNIDATVVLAGPGSVPDSLYQSSYKPFRNAVLQLPGVTSITASSSVMGQEILWSTNYTTLGGRKQGAVNTFQLGVDEEFAPAFGLHFLAGKNIGPLRAGEKTGILNAKAAQEMGFASPGNAINEKVISGNGDTITITGVVADFHQEGLQKEITPLILFNSRARISYSLKMNSGQSAGNIAAIRSLWSHYFPSDPFSYFFLDEFFARQYQENERFGSVFGLFSVLAIVIACMGLLALSAYNVIQRSKEIGVRKVLGATVQDLVIVLSKDFLLLVAVAFVIAIPASWFIMNKWLQSFAFRTGIPWWIFGLSGLLAMLTALVTVGLQGIRAGLANPIRSLRSE